VKRSHHDDRPVLITEAEPSLEEQHRARKRKYSIMMSLRVVFLILAASFYKVTWLMGICAICAVTLPWMAVLIANDRPPKRAMRLDPFHSDRRPDRQVAPTGRDELPSPGAPARVVDAEE
jgi:Protein of unknown function (DUF3099)